MTNTFRSIRFIALVLPLTLFSETLPAKRLALKTRLDAVRVEAICLALQDMESQWPGATSFKAETLQSQLNELQSRLTKAEDSTVETDAEKLLAEVRSALLSLPALKEAKLLLVKRGVKDLALPANWDNVRGTSNNLRNEIVVMENLASVPTTRTLITPRKPNDYLGELALHWDAKRLMFSSQNEKGKMRVYEVNLDAPEKMIEMPQIPDDDVDNLAGCWLADDATLFLSTATMIGVPCVRGGSHIYHLYRQDQEGIRRLTFDQEHNWNPTMLPDGRVIYQRWEYSDLPHFVSRLLFSMNPDGTAQREYYGSNSYWPNSMFYAKPIPDGAGKFAAIVSGHHGVKRMGELIVFDPAKGRFETEGVVQRIPGREKKVEAKISDHLVDNSWPKFLHPLPLGGNYFIAPMKPDAKAPWGLYLVDMFDNMTLIAEDSENAFLEPVLLKPTKRPPVLPSQIAKGKPGYLNLLDIYAGPGLAGVPRGTIKSLRIGTYAYSYRGMGGQIDRVGEDGPWDVRRIIGTVPVSEDGSAFFEVPPNIPLMIQPLDEKGRAVQLMRSWVMSMPGEIQTCVGCHEPLNRSTPANRIDAHSKPIEKIKPWYGPARGFSFNREVQPVLDKYCVGCHDGEDTDLPNFKMRPDQTYLSQNKGYQPAHFPPAYLALKKYVRNHTMESDMHLLKPYEFHASTTDLVRMLEAGHKSVKLDPESWDRLNTWIDLNTPAHGTWTEISGEERTKNLAQRRRELLKQYAAIDEDPEDYEYRAKPHKLNLDGEAIENARPNMILTLRPAPKSTPLVVSPKEVTNGEFAEFDPQHDSGLEVGSFLQFGVLERGFPVNKPEQPVVRVSQSKAKAYCEWLSQKTGKRYRLPTVAERIAFAKTASRKEGNFADLTFHQEETFAPWGLPSGAVLPWRPAETNMNDKARATAPVGSYAPTATGLYDVFGNVWEWTSDMDSGGLAIAMGGSFASLRTQLTERSCVSYLPWQPVFDVGFRVVCEETPSAATNTFPPMLFTVENTKQIIRLDATGKVVWEYPADTARDVWQLPNGNILFPYSISNGANHAETGAMEVTPDKKIVWNYKTHGQVYSCQRMANGNTLIGATEQGKLLIVNPSGELVKSVEIKNAKAGHGSMRSVRELANGHFLIAEESANAAREYDSDGKFLREFKTPYPTFSAIRLPSGNTLTCGKTGITEFDKEGTIIWEAKSQDFPELGIRWFAGLQVLPNGNLLICNAGGKVPLAEINKDKKVIWKSDLALLNGVMGHGIQRLDLPAPLLK